MRRDRPIFVMGFPRSGTTMLQLMLHAHPRVAIPPETRFLLAGHKARHTFGDLSDPANRRELAEWIVRKKTFDDLGLDPDQVAEEITAGPPTLGSAFGIVFRAYARRFDKPRWGDKRPAYLHNVHVLKDLFPDAQFVNIVRDGRDCIASVMEMSWNKRDIYRSVRAWNEGVDHARRAARQLGPETYHEMRYEHVVNDPAAELRRLCDFLGEDFADAMTEPAKVATVAVPERKSWHQLTHSAVTKARVGSWQERLEPWQISLCETAMGSRLESLGYELSGAAGPGLGHRAHYFAVAARGPLVQPKRAAMRLLNKMRAAGPVDCRITVEPVAEHSPGPSAVEPAKKGADSTP